MSTKVYSLDRLQKELSRAFYWMGRATKEAQEGSFAGANTCMTIALQHWNSCQHIDDTQIDLDTTDSLDWKFFTKRALIMAKKELQEDGE